MEPIEQLPSVCQQLKAVAWALSGARGKPQLDEDSATGLVILLEKIADELNGIYQDANSKVID